MRLETYPVEERDLADFAIEAAADDAGEVGKETLGVGEEEEDVAAEGEHSDLLGDGGLCGGEVDVGDEAGVPEWVVVGLRHFNFVMMIEKSEKCSLE